MKYQNGVWASPVHFWQIITQMDQQVGVDVMRPDQVLCAMSHQYLRSKVEDLVVMDEPVGEIGQSMPEERMTMKQSLADWIVEICVDSYWQYD